MLFGAAEGTVLGKSQFGYADGGDTFLTKKERPMARFLLDEPTEAGETALTLEVTRAQFDRLTIGARGKINWWGERLSDFVPGEEAAEPETILPKPEIPEVWVVPAERADAAAVSEEEPQASPEESVATTVAEEPAAMPAGGLERPKEEGATVTPLLRHSPTVTECPWCGKPMDLWRMSSRDGFVAKRGAEVELDWECIKENVKESMTDLLSLIGVGEGVAVKKRPVNKIRLGEGGEVLLRICEECKRAVIDF